MLVILNFSGKETKIILPEMKTAKKLLINNYPLLNLAKDDSLLLQPWQAVIFSTE